MQSLARAGRGLVAGGMGQLRSSCPAAASRLLPRSLRAPPARAFSSDASQPNGSVQYASGQPPAYSPPTAEYGPGVGPADGLVDSWGPVFTGWTVYKTKAAVSVKFIRATWREGVNRSMILEKPGCMLLEFAQAIGERTYDWPNKVMISLSATELGEFLTGAPEDGTSIDIFHDPHKNGPDEGQVTKKLTAQVSPDKRVVFFSVNLNDKRQNKKASVSVSLSPAEMQVFRSLSSFAIPRLLGFDQQFNDRV